MINHKINGDIIYIPHKTLTARTPRLILSGVLPVVYIYSDALYERTCIYTSSLIKGITGHLRRGEIYIMLEN